MDKKEVLEKAQSKKAIVGEMEQAKINKSCWISNIFAVVVAVIFSCVLGAKQIFEGLYAIYTVCLIWATTFYLCQYFIAKRPWQVLIGAVLSGIGAVINFTFFILYVVGVL